MADTSIIKTHIEPYVRKWLEGRFKKTFEDEEIDVELTTGRKHRFDAVSRDRNIIAGIRSSIAKGRGGKGESGKINATYSELYFLDLVGARRKLLVFTDKKFYELFKKKSRGRIRRDIELLFCKLPRYKRKLVKKSLTISSEEIGKKK